MMRVNRSLGYRTDAEYAFVEAAFEHCEHLMPGLKHLPPVDSLDGEHLEDKLGPVDGRGPSRDTKHGDLAAHHQIFDHLVECGRRTAHLQPDIEPFLHAETLRHGPKIFLAHVDGNHVSDIRCQRQTVRIDIGDHDVPSTDVPGNGRAHDANRTCSRDEHILAHEVERQRGVDGVAQWIKDSPDLVVDRVRKRYDIEGGQTQIFRKSPGNVDTDPLGFRIQVKPPSTRGPTAAANNVPLARNTLSNDEIIDVRADLSDLREGIRSRSTSDARQFLAAAGSRSRSIGKPLGLHDARDGGCPVKP